MRHVLEMPVAVVHPRERGIRYQQSTFYVRSSRRERFLITAGDQRPGCSGQVATASMTLRFVRIRAHAASIAFAFTDTINRGGLRGQILTRSTEVRCQPRPRRVSVIRVEIAEWPYAAACGPLGTNVAIAPVRSAIGTRYSSRRASASRETRYTRCGSMTAKAAARPFTESSAS